MFSTPRKGLLTGMIDFFIEPDPKGEFGTQLKELYPIGSKVKVTVQRARLDLTKKKKYSIGLLQQ